MKKIFFALLTLTAMSGLFTSCDEDEKKGLRLSGEWEGEFFSYYTCHYGNEPRDREFYSDWTYMRFFTDGFDVNEGEGYEVDFYNSGPYDYMYYRFFWKVKEGIISLKYYDAPEMNLDIEDYRLTYSYFRGQFGGGYDINLRKLSDYHYCVANYDWDWDWDWDECCTQNYGYYVSSKYQDKYKDYNNHSYYKGYTRTEAKGEPDEEVPFIVSQGRKAKPQIEQ